MKNAWNKFLTFVDSPSYDWMAIATIALTAKSDNLIAAAMIIVFGISAASYGIKSKPEG